MKKTFTTRMPDRVGAFYLADRCITNLGLNITRVSYNKAVDTHTLFLEVEGDEEALARAEAALAALGYLNEDSGTGYSVLDLIHSLEAVSGKKMAITYTPRRAGDIAACYADPTKAKTVLGWEAKLGVEKMCEDAWNYAVKHQ